MSLLVATDLHLSDRPKDAYRFGLFDFLIEKRREHNASMTLILGDITDEKDEHTALLVNRVVDGFKRLAEEAPVVIMMGNHDYLADPTNPFFKFLNNMMNIRFVITPRTLVTNEGSKLLFLPHFNDEQAWDNFRLDTHPDFVFIHQTVTGAISESGRRLDGFSLKPLKRLKDRRIFGGDVHKPHTIDLVTYIGPPYHVRFGDNFVPRCVLINEATGKTKNLYFECPRKWSKTIRDPEELLNDDTLRAGDQIKVSLELTREEVVEWPVYKDRVIQIIKELGLESYGIELKVDKTVKRKKDETTDKVAMKHRTPSDIIGSFSKAEKLSSVVRKTGLKLLEE